MHIGCARSPDLPCLLIARPASARTALRMSSMLLQADRQPRTSTSSWEVIQGPLASHPLCHLWDSNQMQGELIKTFGKSFLGLQNEKHPSSSYEEYRIELPVLELLDVRREQHARGSIGSQLAKFLCGAL